LFRKIEKKGDIGRKKEKKRVAQATIFVVYKK